MICSMIWTKVLRGCVRSKASWILVAALFAAPANAEDLRVFAAASLTDALDQALEVCAAKTEIPATGIYSGSGTIARQIEHGAPADIYISANPQWMDWLDQRGMIAPATRVDLLGNRLVMIENRAAQSEATTETPFAIADPETVPVGRYTKQALESTSAWPPAASKLVYASNVREVLAWVARGEAQHGVVYASDAKAEARVAVIKEFAESKHDPIRYPAALVADRDTTKAKRLLACLKGEEASDVFRQFGFSVLTR